MEADKFKIALIMPKFQRNTSISKLKKQTLNSSSKAILNTSLLKQDDPKFVRQLREQKSGSQMSKNACSFLGAPQTKKAKEIIARKKSAAHIQIDLSSNTFLTPNKTPREGQRQYSLGKQKNRDTNLVQFRPTKSPIKNVSATQSQSFMSGFRIKAQEVETLVPQDQPKSFLEMKRKQLSSKSLLNKSKGKVANHVAVTIKAVKKKQGEVTQKDSSRNLGVQPQLLAYLRSEENNSSQVPLLSLSSQQNRHYNSRIPKDADIEVFSLKKQSERHQKDTMTNVCTSNNFTPQSQQETTAQLLEIQRVQTQPYQNMLSKTKEQSQTPKQNQSQIQYISSNSSHYTNQKETEFNKSDQNHLQILDATTMTDNSRNGELDSRANLHTKNIAIPFSAGSMNENGTRDEQKSSFMPIPLGVLLSKTSGGASQPSEAIFSEEPRALQGKKMGIKTPKNQNLLKLKDELENNSQTTAQGPRSSLSHRTKQTQISNGLQEYNSPLNCKPSTISRKC